ncbi:HTH_48 domain-containing protein [Trichonephila clavipes]|uniref:HTH_48 domain-containing protein n=1 Tax=Trichonephila clavipes TaxID=2585209 RepID=A0A8X6VF31_TRICX|nr:HTH_48 domain-containing protein [Trichonephila clavipes]
MSYTIFLVLLSIGLASINAAPMPSPQDGMANLNNTMFEADGYVFPFDMSGSKGIAEIHRQISDVYGPNAMSSSKVRKWVRAFKDGPENVHSEPRSSRSSVITDDLVNAVDEKICETGDSQFQL